MSARTFEQFLAKLYVDAASRAAFLADPRAAAAAEGLTPEECEVLARIDFAGLELAAESFARKRSQKSQRRGARPLLARVAGWWRG
jgi:Aromatic-ring-opening dioxygenase LigAB, LigA subunit